VHHLIRFELGRRGVKQRVPILYGGSVNQANVLGLLAREELDGVLVGGASLDADGWAELVGLGG
jgi:triosephosphate isomerase